LESSKFRKINLEDFKLILEVFPIPIDIVDLDLNILYMNDALKKKVGRDATGEKCFEVYKDKAVQCEYCPLKEELTAGDYSSIKAEGAFGGKIVTIRHKVIELRGKKYVLEIFEDITESITDELTGCFNRRKLKEDLKEELKRAERYNNDLSVLMIDIDWFKEYNDFHGHQKGDILLVKLVRTLSYNIRFNDKLYRYGGEEFVVLLPETSEGEAKGVAEKLRSKIEEKKFIGEEKSQPAKSITISVGIASYPRNGPSSSKIIFAADSALYEAKASGKNIIKVATS
jgi:diguanylate cyclase (GGDEF)-like protein